MTLRSTTRGSLTRGSSGASALARLDGLSYWYPGGISALVDVSLDLGPGLTVLAGPSGGGKSSLLRVFNGLVPHFHGGRITGRANVLGLDVLATPTRLLARDVGFVFQDPEKQVVYGTVEREVAFGLENVGFERSEMVRRVGESLERLGLEELRGRSVATLSGGERQRVAIASVMAMRPRLIVLDEPTSELDRSGAAAVVDACLDLVAGGTGVLIAEHRLERLLPTADRLVVVEAGRAAERPKTAIDPPVGRIAGGSSGPATIAWTMGNLVAGPAGIGLLECPELVGRTGEVTAIVGDNGSGKTSLLRTLAGLLAPISGSIERRPGRVAYLPQDPGALLHRPTVLAEVAWTLDHAEADGRGESVEAVARACLAEFGLEGLADRDPRDLSAGERQRAALAVILAGEPRIALLDEPTRGMDELARQALARALRRLQDDGCSIVIATHDERLVAQVADRIVAIEDGRLRELPSPAPTAPASGEPALALAGR